MILASALDDVFKRAKSDAQLFGGPELYDYRIADGLELTRRRQPSPA